MFEARFQSFSETADRAATPERAAALRRQMAQRGVDAFIVPHADRHQNEYLPASEERLAWLSGFTGSAGRAIVLADTAVLFVDGRYTLQAHEQVDPTLFTVVPVSETTPESWVEANLKSGARLGYDPWLHTASEIETLTKICSALDVSLIPLDPNPLDAVWTDRPPPPLGPVSLHGLAQAGESAADKLARIQAELVKLRADALVVSSPAALAWAFNIRGADVTHTPVALGFAIVPAEGRPTVYIDARKLGDDVRRGIDAVAEVREPDDFARQLQALGQAHASIRLDQTSAAQALATTVTQAGGKVTRGPDPIALMRAVKNATEIAGARAAQHRDAAAMARFLAWFDAEAGGGKLTEIDCVTALESFRRDAGARDISFPTIAGAGPNGAIVHYRVTEKSNRRIQQGELFLIDSGGQYVDGTTDITRTVAVGAPDAEMRERFTRVLRGHIGIARAVFPEGVAGAQLDSFARQHLWTAGLDYDHGTGHGVGSYLSVHEGPASIHKSNLTALKRGMILSNEPGYYKTGAYGIRIENLVLVVEGPSVEGGEKSLNAFETLTLAPIDRRLIEPSLMTADEIAWLDAYHARVAAEIAPLLDARTRGWLEQAVAPIQRGPAGAPRFS